MTKILIVSTYPIKNAQHGGQRRVTAIAENYRKASFTVRVTSVFPPDYYQHYSRHDIAVKGKVRKQTTDSPYTGDITCGMAIYHDAHVKKKFTKLLREFKPDIIQVEQVFPYLGIKPLIKELGISPKIILSSHNIEYIQKHEILTGSGYAEEADEATKLIKDCETDMAKNSDLVIAVSQGDAEKLVSMGAKDVVVAPNGISKQRLTQKAQSYWADYKESEGLSKFAIFVGSAHPPNWFGFLDMVGDRMGFLSKDKKIILAGSIADYFKDNFNDLKPEHITFWRRVFPAGRLDDDLMTGLIDQSEVIILPITEGGGSNLKTAEAILSGKKIVATSYAFRSFERYLKLPNLYIADTSEDFRKAINEALVADYTNRTADERQLASEVQWSYSLRPMIEGANKL